jgi:hypothetical protein
LDWIVAELCSASGLAGGVRAFTDGAERARVAVCKAIRRALDCLEAADPVIGRDLRLHVRTGSRCGYRLP